MANPTETRVPMDVIMVRAMCPVCGSVMVFSGSTLTMNPPMFEHKCSSPECHVREYYSRQYPSIEYHERPPQTRLSIHASNEGDEIALRETLARDYKDKLDHERKQETDGD